MNAEAFTALKKEWPVQYVGPVNPPVADRAKILSKLLRTVGLRGSFVFFSPHRLAAIAGEIARFKEPVTINFFHGFTPWIMTRPADPYVAWSDCTFRDYIDTYHDRARFRANDLTRIEAAEAAWLKGAAAVLLTSEWAARRAIRDYGIEPSRVHSVGIFGECRIPARDAYAGNSDFVFVSTDFAAKGGPVVLSAFRILQRRWPDARMIVVGDRPVGLGHNPAVIYRGFMRKEQPDELQAFEHVLATARAVVHPTKSDIAPLLLVEAGYFGCPAIASRRAAIPELITDGQTGLLIDDPGDPQCVAEAMAAMLSDDEKYRAMRRNVWQKTHTAHSRSAFEDRLLAHVRASIAA